MEASVWTRSGPLSATHHGRMDGSGYHRGLGAAMLLSQARLLGAAHVYLGLMEPRPYREALTEADARHRLRAKAARGRRADGPMGLTARESEVIGLLAQGFPNKSIATRLGISPRTVGNHVEGAYGRAYAAQAAGPG